MLGFAGIPSVLMFAGLLFMPESPRWLIFHGKKERAWRILRRIHSPDEAKQEFQSIVESYKEHSQSQIGA